MIYKNRQVSTLIEMLQTFLILNTDFFYKLHFIFFDILQRNNHADFCRLLCVFFSILLSTL